MVNSKDSALDVLQGSLKRAKTQQINQNMTTSNKQISSNNSSASIILK